MPTPSNIIEQLKRDEALMLTPYRDSSKATGFEGKPGKLTIGYGRNLEDEGITREEAVAMLNDDIFAKEKLLLRALPWSGNLLNTPDAPRFWVLVNMAFNMGIEGLLKFHRMLSAMEAKNWEAAAQEMLNSDWVNEVGDRARRLAEQMRTGEWQ